MLAPRLILSVLYLFDLVFLAFFLIFFFFSFFFSQRYRHSLGSNVKVARESRGREWRTPTKQSTEIFRLLWTILFSRVDRPLTLISVVQYRLLFSFRSLKMDYELERYGLEGTGVIRYFDPIEVERLQT